MRRFTLDGDPVHDAPMPVILIGAIGGMVAAGIIGLFSGAVVLAIAYQLFMAWVDDAQPPGNEEEGEAGDKAAATG